MECPEFRELIFYCTDELDEDTLVGRSALVNLLLDYYNKIHQEDVRAIVQV